MLVFDHLFRLKGVERLLPAGSYEVMTDEDTIRRPVVSLLSTHRAAQRQNRLP
jgi:hypothetical protein